MKRRARRLGRILFNTLTAMSLILALVTAGLWVRNLFAADFLIFCTDRAGQDLHYLELGSAHGRISLGAYAHSRQTKTPNGASLLPEHFGPVSVIFEIQGAYRPISERLFGRAERGLPFTAETGYCSISHWFLFVFAAMLPTTRFTASIVRRKRYRLGHCPSCGYDTRANPLRRSECGREIAPSIS